MKKSIFILVIFFASIFALSVFLKEQNPATMSNKDESASTNKVYYSCDDGKSIQASFSSNNVSLSLSNGQNISIPQTVSGSGIRYESTTGSKDSFSFIGKGDDAFLVHNEVNIYDNCLAGSISFSKDGNINSFTDQSKTFTFDYPSFATLSGGGIGYTEDWSTNNQYHTLGMILAKVIIGRDYMPNTNFSEAKVLIGTSSENEAVKSCNKGDEWSKVDATPININGVSFTKIKDNDAGAGNFYETTRYKTIKNDQCYEISYTIHSTNIGNYSPDQGIKQFDENIINETLENIIKSFKFI